MSTYGTLLRTALFGESHGPRVGALVTGFPAGVRLDLAEAQAQLDRRRPGQSAVTTQRKEEDTLEVWSGLFKGHSTGAPILLSAVNADRDSSKYDPNRPRPGHADLAGHLKFYGHQDWRGGGHFGGRLTFGLVAAGALARQAMERAGTRIVAYTQSIGGLALSSPPDFDSASDLAEANDVRCPDPELAKQMRHEILRVRNQGDSLGGIVACQIQGIPAGLGGYHQDSFESRMGQLLLGIPAVKGVGFGDGFQLAERRGTESNDAIGWVGDRPMALTSRQGGTVGGITDGSPVRFQVAFKPTSSLTAPQETVDLAQRTPHELRTQGRHDPCIVPRAVPVVENAVALAVLDMWLARLGEEAFHQTGATQ